MSNHYLGSRERSTKKSMEPKVLYKKSNLLFDFSTELVTLGSVCFADNDETGIPVNAEAVCKGVDFHGRFGFEAPVRGCRCGFHAYHDYVPASIHGQQGNFVLRVVASGKLLEYDKGYRYGHQRVEEVIVRECRWCHSRYADRVEVYLGGKVIPVCREDSKRRGVYALSFNELGERMSVTLPDHAPRITVRSENKNLLPWKDISLPQRVVTTVQPKSRFVRKLLGL